jgi:hypothetical protein
MWSSEIQMNKIHFHRCLIFALLLAADVSELLFGKFLENVCLATTIKVREKTYTDLKSSYILQFSGSCYA